VIGDGAVGEAGDEAAVTGVPRVAAHEFGAEAEVFLPIDELEGVGEGAFGTKLDDGGVEGGVGGIVGGDESAVDVEFKVVVGDDVGGDEFAVGVDDDGLYGVGGGALVVEVGCGAGGVGGLGGDSEDGAIGGGDAADGAGAVVIDGLRAFVEVFGDGLGAALGDVALGESGGGEEEGCLFTCSKNSCKALGMGKLFGRAGN
jgi:hypothetical protein